MSCQYVVVVFVTCAVVPRKYTFSTSIIGLIDSDHKPNPRKSAMAWVYSVAVIVDDDIIAMLLIGSSSISEKKSIGRCVCGR